MINTGLFTSLRDDWETPQSLFNELNKEFNFTLDPCASANNRKCERFFTKNEDGLQQDWGGHNCFVNPPYGKELPKWILKSYKESQKPNTLVVMLIPARTDTKAFHDYIYGKAKIRFIRGRIKFDGAKYNAPFPSMIVIFGEKKEY